MSFYIKNISFQNITAWLLEEGEKKKPEKTKQALSVHSQSVYFLHSNLTQKNTQTKENPLIVNKKSFD